MASPEIHNLARQLIASQTARATAAAADVASAAGALADALAGALADALTDDLACVDVATQVVDELRLRLIKLAGIDGFRSLLARALVMARKEAPSLCDVQVRDDGTLQGFDVEHLHQANAETSAEAGAILVAHLLDLLITFIGEPLTLQLVRDAWIDASLNGTTSAERKV